ncbi:MAG: hypothetical protein JSS07_07950 [Proteobacteria bacterium]|nr:hypothetical protein [Pseudomonadota bacterium]
MTKPVIIIELNEFNVDLLLQATKQFSLPAIAKVLNFNRTQYKTNDRYNSGFLEPWVQWVSIHAGNPSQAHQIKHLGDVPDLRFEQCWETLSHHGISSGIWGVMNGARNHAKEVHFFLPDPWTFSERAHPNALNYLLDLPRYVSKNYQNLSKAKLFFKAIKLIYFILTSKVSGKIFKKTFCLLKDLHKHHKQHFVYISYFDYISTLLFAQYKQKYQPRCSILFLNSLAHLQHHHWTKGALTVTDEIRYGLETLDQLLAYLFKLFPQDAFIVHNGLSQMNTNHEKPWVLYRQKDPQKFLQALQLPFTSVEQHMTHDGHVFFASTQQCQQAFEILKEAKINDKALFHVEKNAHDEHKLFYMLKFTDKLASNATFTVNHKEFTFFEHFDAIVTRTGRHIQMGTILSDTVRFPDQINNHDFNRYLFNYFKPDAFPIMDEFEIFNDELESEFA